MALHFPPINLAPSASYGNSRASSLEKYQIQVPNKYNHPTYQPNQQESLHSLSPKKSPVMPSLGYLDAGGPSQRGSQAEMSPVFNLRVRHDLKHQNSRNDLMPFQLRRTDSQAQEEPHSAQRNLLRLNPLHEPHPNNNSLNPRALMQQPSLFTDRPSFGNVDSATRRNNSPFKEPDNIASFETRLNKHLERQNTVLERILTKIDSQTQRNQNEYKMSIDNQIKQFQKKKSLAEFDSERLAPKRRGTRELEPNYLLEKPDIILTEEISSNMKTRRRGASNADSAKQQIIDEIDSRFNLLDDYDYVRSDRAPIAPNQLDRQTPNMEYMSLSGMFRKSSDGSTQKRVLKLNRKIQRSEDYSVVGTERRVITEEKPSMIMKSEISLEENRSSKKLSSKVLEKIAQKRLIKMDTVRLDKMLAEGRLGTGAHDDEEIEVRRSATKVVNMMKRMKKAQMRIKSIMWFLLGFKLLFNDKKKRAIGKKDLLEKEIMVNLHSNCGVLEKFVLQMAGKNILSLLTDKQYSFVFVSAKKISAKKLDKECGAFLESVKGIFEILSRTLSSLPENIFKFFRAISEEDSLLPSGFFTEFELNRLEFNYFGCLKHVIPSQSKFIIGGIFILRIFLHGIIMPPWEVFDTPLTKFNYEKLLNIGSVIYNAFMEIFKTLPTQDSHRLASLELKVNAKKNTMNAINNTAVASRFNIKKNPSRESEIINGFYSKQQLACFFKERKDLAIQLKNIMQHFLETLYNLVHKKS